MYPGVLMSHIVLHPSFLLVPGAATPDVLLKPGEILTHTKTLRSHSE